MLLNSVFKMYSFVFTWVYVFVGVCMCADTCRGQRPTLGVSLSFALHLVFWDGGLFLNLELTGSTRPADQKAPGISPMLGLQECAAESGSKPGHHGHMATTVLAEPLTPQQQYSLVYRHSPNKNVRQQSVMLKAKAFHLTLLHSWTYPCNSLRFSRTRW